jgi:hypothetical protein
VQQLFLSVDDVTSGPEVAAVARVIKKSAIALSRYQKVRQCSLQVSRYAIALSEYQENRHCTLPAATALTKNQEAAIALYSTATKKSAIAFSRHQ